MKISEQARKAADDCDVGDGREYHKIIQRAINDHERDLVEAAERVLGPFTTLNVHNAVAAIDALKAALDRRKE